MIPTSTIIFREIIRRFWRDKCIMSAQALTYNTVFALIPLLAFALSVVRFFVGTEEIINRINEALSRFLNPGALSKAQQTIFSLIAEAQRAPLGAASMILFLVMTIGLLMQFEEVINDIFHVKNRRTFLQKITIYWMGLTLGPLLVALPLGVSVYLAHLGLKGMGVVPLLLKFWTIPTVILLFTSIYIYLPATKIKLIPALVGASISAILWVIIASLYAFYTSKAVAYSKLYGSLSVIPLFLLWLWVNWMVVLLGAEVAAVLQQKNKIILDYKYQNDTSLLLLGLATMLVIYHHHHEGKDGPDIIELSKTLKTSPFKLEKILEQLMQKNLLYTIGNKYVLAKDAEILKIEEIENAIDGNIPEKEPETNIIKAAYHFLKEKRNIWSQKTLKELYKNYQQYEESKDGQMSEM